MALAIEQPAAAKPPCPFLDVGLTAYDARYYRDDLGSGFRALHERIEVARPAVRLVAVVADGATRLLIEGTGVHEGGVRVEATAWTTFSLPDPDLDGGFLPLGGSVAREGALTVNWEPISETRKGVFVLYAVPEHFVIDPSHRALSTRTNYLEAVTTIIDPQDNSCLVTNRLELQIMRPPLLFAHGLWSSPAAWRTTAERLAQELPGLRIYYLNYADTADRAFAANVGRVPAAIRAVRELEASTGTAVTRVDFVGHSMGGLLGRVWAGSDGAGGYRRKDNYDLGDFNKLITVNSPHEGSFLADRALAALACLPAHERVALLLAARHFGHALDRGALRDLATGSAALRAMDAATVRVRCAAIAGRFLADDLCGAYGWVGFVCALFNFHHAGSSCVFNSGDPPPGDLVVTLPSQSPGIPTATFPLHHMEAPAHPLVHRQLIEMLNATSAEANMLFASGFGSSSSAAPPPIGAAVHTPAPDLGAEPVWTGPFLRVGIAEEPARVKPGATIHLLLRAGDGAPLTEAIACAGSSWKLVRDCGSRIEFRLPADITGPLDLWAAARSAHGSLYASTLRLELRLDLDETVVAIETEPPAWVFTRPTDRLRLTVTALTSSGLRLEINCADVVFLSEDSSVAMVTHEGVITGVNTGRTAVQVAYADHMVSVPITVGPEQPPWAFEPWDQWVISTNPSGPGSLAQAVWNAYLAYSQYGRPGRIRFDLPGAGPHTIQTGVIGLNSPVILDGWSQPGFAGQPLIELRANTTNLSAGVAVHSAGCMVRGLAIDGFRTGIYVGPSGSSRLEGNWIGTSHATGLGRPEHGIHLDNSARNLVGGLDPARRNVIGSTSAEGLLLRGANATANQIVNNWIHTDTSGVAVATSPMAFGIALYHAPSNIVGAAHRRYGNVVTTGVLLSGAATAANEILGNRLGYDADDVATDFGSPVLLRDAAHHNPIGGRSEAAANHLAPMGIWHDAGEGNAILVNRFANSLPIFLGWETADDDPLDADTGPNRGQNSPRLDSALQSLFGLEIVGHLQSEPGRTYQIDVYASHGADGWYPLTAYRQAFSVRTGLDGTSAFRMLLPVRITTPASLSAVATDAAGNSSPLGTRSVELTDAIDRPELLPVANVLAQPNQTVVLALATSDPHEPAELFSFRLHSGPPGLELDRCSGVIHWTVPPDTTPGVYRVTFEVGPLPASEANPPSDYAFDIRVESPAPPRFTRIMSASGAFDLTYVSDSERRLRLERSADLDSWEDLVEVPGGAGTHRVRLIPPIAPAPSSRGFFRLRVE